MRVVSVAQMRELEAATFAAGTPEAELQGRAGRAVADAVAGRCPEGRSVVALVGPGNNGRDAWISAAALSARGWDAILYLTPRHALTELELAGFVADGGRVARLPEHRDQPAASLDPVLEPLLAQADVAIDGLLGIGSRGAPRPPLDAVVRALNAVHERTGRPFVVAVDNPSGLDADTGHVPGDAVRADATVVLGAAKQGLLTPAAVPYTGQLVFAEIGIVPGPEGAPRLIDLAALRSMLPRPAADVHKYAFGRVLVVAGSDRYVGAAYLACAAAIRAGAGVVTLAAPRWLRDVVASRLAEVTFLPLPDGGLAGAPDASAARILEELDGSTALAIGPGLSLEGGVGDVVEAILRDRARRRLPAVVDADGLNALARRSDWPAWIGPDVVFTPHFGELRRLLSGDPGSIGEAADVDPAGPSAWERIRALADRWGVTLLLKGPFTVVGSDGEVWIHPGPNPVLATAGTGDVLTGIIAGLLARGLSPSAAARLGVWVHGRAGAAMAGARPAGGLMASELLGEIPAGLATVLERGVSEN